MNTNEILTTITVPIIIIIWLIIYSIKHHNMQENLKSGDHVWYENEDGKKTYGVIDEVFENYVTIRPKTADGVAIHYQRKNLVPVIFIRYKR